MKNLLLARPDLFYAYVGIGQVIEEPGKVLVSLITDVRPLALSKQP